MTLQMLLDEFESHSSLVCMVELVDTTNLKFVPQGYRFESDYEQCIEVGNI